MAELCPTKDDQQIAQLVQKGNAELFGVLVNRYEAKITRYAKKFLFHGEDAEDLVQDIFIKAYRNMQSFDPDRAFSPWLYRIAHNEFINALKKKGREKLSFIDFDVLFPNPIAPEKTDTEAEQNDMRRVLDNCLQSLNPKYREPLVLYYFEHMEYAEIADILQIPVATVGVRLQRGKAMLQKLLPQGEHAL